MHREAFLMGDRIVIDITDGTEFTPSFYGHWCGLRAIKVLNDLVRAGEYNGLNSLMCNLVLEVMERKPQQYSYYLYNHGEAEKSADWDNFTWCFNLKTRKWTSTDPQFQNRVLSMDDTDEFVRKERPCLFRQCKCEDYGGKNCTLSFIEAQEKKDN